MENNKYLITNLNIGTRLITPSVGGNDLTNKPAYVFNDTSVNLVMNQWSSLISKGEMYATPIIGLNKSSYYCSNEATLFYNNEQIIKSSLSDDALVANAGNSIKSFIKSARYFVTTIQDKIRGDIAHQTYPVLTLDKNDQYISKPTEVFFEKYQQSAVANYGGISLKVNSFGSDVSAKNSKIGEPMADHSNKLTSIPFNEGIKAISDVTIVGSNWTNLENNQLTVQTDINNIAATTDLKIASNTKISALKINKASKGSVLENKQEANIHTKANVELITTDSTPTEYGFTIISELGTSTETPVVSSAGDVNGDGLDDLIVGIKGKSYIVFGKNTGSSINLGNIASGIGGFVVNGDSISNYMGMSVSSAGDVNGDGFYDLIIGAPRVNINNNEHTGRSYVVFGKDTGSAINLSSITTDKSGFILNGEPGEESGYSVSSAGDVNGDGLDDLIVGAPKGVVNYIPHAGKSYVVFGKTDSNTVELIDIKNLETKEGFVLNGETTNRGGSSGTSVSSAGDVNGDGLDDLIVGAYSLSVNNVSSVGRSYVVFGQTDKNSINLVDIKDPNNTGGFAIDGESSNDLSGRPVSSAGDVNGDGLSDLIISAWYSDGGRGKTYVVFGKTTSENVSLADVSAGTGGFVINGEELNDYSGHSVSSAGDVNGDGLSDLIISAPNFGNPKPSKYYVVFGKTTQSAVSLSNIVVGTGGFVINGEHSGGVVSSAGDVNGDGLDDLIVSVASVNSNAPNTGKSYVVFGKTNTNAIDLKNLGLNSQYAINYMGDSSDNRLISTDSNKNEIFIAGAGDDVLIGNGGMDVFHAGLGDDTIIISNNNIVELEKIGAGNRARIDGGTGIDTLQFDGTNITLDLNKISNTRIKNIEEIDLTGAGNTLKINLLSLLAISSTNIIKVLGDDRNIVSAIDFFKITSKTENHITFDVYRHAGNADHAQLLIANNIVITDVVTTLFYEDANFTETADNQGVVEGFMDIVLAKNTFADNDSVINANHYDVTNVPDGLTMVIAKIDSTHARVTFTGAATNHTAIDSLDNISIIFKAEAFTDAIDATKIVNNNKQDVAINFSNPITRGFVIKGELPTDESGRDVSSAGDINGDGLDDFIIGAPFATLRDDLVNAGKTYVVFSKATGDPIDLKNLIHKKNGMGFAIVGETSNEWSGSSVSYAGDVNGDGLDDLIIGALHSSPSDTQFKAGKSYVVFGKTTSDLVSLTDISNGVGGFVINGARTGDYSGAVSSAGDVNGDGLDDLIVGAYAADPSDTQTNAGQSFVIFGKTNTNAVQLNSIISNSEGGFVINGESQYDNSGVAVSSAGDVNGDGLDDLLIGAPNASPSNSNISAGKTYVVFGTASSSPVNLNDITTPNNKLGFVINGEYTSDGSGRSVASAGDVNGDGLDDLIIGVPNAIIDGRTLGKTYVIFGKTTSDKVELEDVAKEHKGGFVINGIVSGDIGGSVSSAGDVNGDGLNDIIISSYHYARQTSTGKSYVIFGSAINDTIEISDIKNGNGGFVINGKLNPLHSSPKVSSAGDVNGDGLDDLLIGSYDANSTAGESYIVFGKTDTRTVELKYLGADSKYAIDYRGDEHNNTLKSSDADKDEIFVAGAGNDILIGDGGMDVFHAGSGDDVIIINGGNIAILESNVVGNRAHINGGGNIDTLKLGGENLILDLTKINNHRIQDIEKIDLAGLGNKILNLDFYDLVSISSSGNTLKILGNSDNAVNAIGFHKTVEKTENGSTFDVYIHSDTNPHSNAQLWIEKDIVVTGSTLLYDDSNFTESRANDGSVDGSMLVTLLNDSFVGANSAIMDASHYTVQNVPDGLTMLVFKADDTHITISFTGKATAHNNNASISDIKFSFKTSAFATVDANNNTVDIAIDFMDLLAVDLSSDVGIQKTSVTEITSTQIQIGVSFDSDISNTVDENIKSIKVVLGGADFNKNHDKLLLDNNEINLNTDLVKVTGKSINNIGGLEYTYNQSSNTLIISKSSGTFVATDVARVVESIKLKNTDANSQIGTRTATITYIDTSNNESASATATLKKLLYHGFIINGETTGDYSGYSVSSAGDVNGDGLDDLIIGACKADVNNKSNAGKTYVVFGKTTGDAINLDEIAINNTGGFVINGELAHSMSGASVSSAGDVNGDGLDDLIIGSWGGGLMNTGKSYVVLGKITGTPVELSEVAKGIGGFTINGEKIWDYSGYSVSSAGDVNGDGLDDLIVGSYLADSSSTKQESGKSYVVFGKIMYDYRYSVMKTIDYPVDLSVIAQEDNQDGFAINGEKVSDYSGFSVSSAGDVNGDGLDDLIIGAWGGDVNNQLNTGKSYVVFGKNTGYSINLSDIAIGRGGFVINGEKSGDRSGYCVSSAGDVNGDGLDDLIVGTRNSTLTSSGSAYVVFGKNTGNGINLYDISNAHGTNADGFVINGALTNIWVSGAGDVNGDGLDDLIIGDSSDGSGSLSGKSYVVFGKATNNAININNIKAGIGGFVLDDEAISDQSSYCVSSAGDVNGDGLDDLIVGILNKSGIGKSYVVFGKTDTNFVSLSNLNIGSTNDIDYLGDVNNNILRSTGINKNEIFVAGSGDDVLIGKGGMDVFNAGQGDDRIIINANNIAFLESNAAGNRSRVNGGSNNDTLRLDGEGLILDLTKISNNRIQNIEKIDLTKIKGNTLKLTLNDLLSISSSSNILKVLGNSDDTVIAAGFSKTTSKTDNYIDYDIYTHINTKAQLWIESRIVTLVSLEYSTNRLVEANDYNGAIDGAITVTLTNDTFVGGDTDVIHANHYVANNVPAGLTMLITKTDSTHAQIILTGSANAHNNSDDVNNIGIVFKESAFTTTANIAKVLNNNKSDITIDFATSVDLDPAAGIQNISLTRVTKEQIKEGVAFDASIAQVGDTNIQVIKVVFDGIDFNDILVLGSNEIEFNKNVATGVVAENDFKYTYIQSSRTLTMTANTNAFLAENVSKIVESIKLKNVDEDPQVRIKSATITYIDTDNNESDSATMSLDVIKSSNSYRGFTINNKDGVGNEISCAGDINGDGLDDYIISTVLLTEPEDDDEDYMPKFIKSTESTHYVVFGTVGGNVDLANIAKDTNHGGFVINKKDTEEKYTHTFSAAGDVNGDGLDDLIIGNNWYGTKGRPMESYVVFGKTGGESVNLSEIAAGAGGFVINEGKNDMQSGYVVSSAGDVNGDGLDDLIIGAWKKKADSVRIVPSREYIVFGKTTTNAINLGDIYSASTASADASDTAYNDNFSMYGFVINYAVEWSYNFNNGLRAMSSAGDVNADGLDDLIIGVPEYGIMSTNYNWYSGIAYVVFGKTDGSAVNIADISKGVGGFSIYSSNDSYGDLFGATVSAGDINGDGLSDLIVGSKKGRYGKFYVIFGKKDIGNVNVDVELLKSNNAGFLIESNNGVLTAQRMHKNTASVGDFNGDGLDDILVGTWTHENADKTYTEKSYLVFGKTTSETISVQDVENGIGGFLIYSEYIKNPNYKVFSFSPAGDINGDGFDDLIAGSMVFKSSFIIFGGTNTDAIDLLNPGHGSKYKIDCLGDDKENTLIGTAEDEIFVAGAGDDVLIGNGGMDVLNAGNGDDVIIINASNIKSLENNSMVGNRSHIDGGSGIDTLKLQGEDITLDFSKIDSNKIEDIEKIDLSYVSGGNIIKLNLYDLLNISDGRILKITDNNIKANTNTVYADNFYQKGTITEDNIAYNIYSHSDINAHANAALWIQSSIHSIL